jgi:hypothetical protein
LSIRSHDMEVSETLGQLNLFDAVGARCVKAGIHSKRMLIIINMATLRNFEFIADLFKAVALSHGDGSLN